MLALQAFRNQKRREAFRYSSIRAYVATRESYYSFSRERPAPTNHFRSNTRNILLFPLTTICIIYCCRFSSGHFAYLSVAIPLSWFSCYHQQCWHLSLAWYIYILAYALFFALFHRVILDLISYFVDKLLFIAKSPGRFIALQIVVSIVVFIVFRVATWSSQETWRNLFYERGEISPFTTRTSTAETIFTPTKTS